MANPATGEVRKLVAGKHVEYRVREIKRYLVTRHEQNVSAKGVIVTGSNRQIGSEYDNYEMAYAVGYALAAKEHDDLGYDLEDERIQYPQSLDAINATQVPL